MCSIINLQKRLQRRLSYQSESRLGSQSPNSWIRKSSNILGWLHEGEHEYLWELGMRPVQGHILEIGSWYGKSTCILAGTCADRGDQSKTICVDSFCMDGSPRQVTYYHSLHKNRLGTFYEFIANANHYGFSEYIIPVAIYSRQSGPVLKSKSFRLAFIDGQHSYAGVKGDLELVLPLVVSGGVVAIHDVDNRYPGIGKAIEETLQKANRVSFLGRIHCLVAYTIREDT